eukprot:RCo000600
MGQDKLKHGKRGGGRRTHTKSENPYLRVLIRIYKFLQRRAACPFNRAVASRLIKSRMYRPPVSTGKIVRCMHMPQNRSKIAVVVGDVTCDTFRMFLPKLNVCALRFTKLARRRIEKSGGKCLTFDQLAMIAPKGTDCMLIRGCFTRRVVNKRFGAPGSPGSHAQPKLGGHKSNLRGRGFEKARGRRNSRGYKVHS